jgi:prepilin-type processing-associated H-X9-DG protein
MYKGQISGYGVNGAIYPYNTIINISQITTPSSTILMADSAVVFGNVNKVYMENNLTLPSDGVTPTIHARHQERANVVWYDGHAKSNTLYYQTTSDLFGLSSAQLKATHLGYIMPAGCNLGDPCQDYYYQIDK